MISTWFIGFLSLFFVPLFLGYLGAKSAVELLGIIAGFTAGVTWAVIGLFLINHLIG